jgi:hypothetical protein
VSAQRYGPEETWPRHQKPFWSTVLGQARQAGWTLVYLDAPHHFGTVICPGGACTFEVDKTARGGEFHAKEAGKKIRGCLHGATQPGSKVRTRQEEASRLLNQAERLIAKAAEGLSQAERRQITQDDLDRFEDRLRTAELTIDDVLRDEQEAALQAALQAEGAPRLRDISTTLADAKAAVQQGEAAAKALGTGRPALAKALLNRARDGHIRIAHLRTRLKALQERE